MTKTKTERVTRRSVLASFLALAVCMSMLIGTSYAWFTDSVTSAGNIIKSGKLDVEMYWADGTDKTDENAKWQDASKGAIFTDDVLWEPGFVQVRHINIQNVGSLAFQYKIAIVANGELEKNDEGHTLADAIDVYYADPAVQVTDRTQLTEAMFYGKLSDVLANIASDANTAQGVLYPVGATAGGKTQDTVTIALKMRESAGNEYQNMTLGTNFSVQLLATQYTYETDSFNDQYDASAHNHALTSLAVDGITVTVSQDFADSVTYNGAGKLNGATLVCPEDLVALATLTNNGKTAAGEGNGSKYAIADDIDMTGVAYTPISTMFSSLDGQGHTISNLNNSLFNYAGAITVENLVLKNVNVTAATAGIIAGNGEGLTLKNVEIAGTNTVAYDPDGWHVHNAEHKGAGVLTALDAGITIGEGVKITGDVTVNYNDVEFKFGNGYDLNNESVTTMFGAKYAGTPSDASGISVTGNITTDGSYTCWQKPVTVTVAGTNYEVSPAFAESLGTAWDDGQITGGERFTAKINSADDMAALSKMISVSPWVGADWSNMVTLDITEDLDFSGVDWNPLGGRASLTINGNGHKISNINDCFMSYVGYTFINDLTLENVTASGEQMGAFVGAAEGVTLNNCVLAGNINVSYAAKSTETWRGVGAFIGWQSENATFNNVSIADNAVVNVVTTGIEDGHADTSLLSHNAYVGKGAIPTITVGENATVTLTE